MSEDIVLYDLPSQHKGKESLSSFSFNPWKTRMVLNYKKLPYRTEWTEYPDVAPKLRGLGVQPNEPGTAFAEYSSPAIRFPDGSITMNSIKLVEQLENMHPEPSLRLDSKLYIPMTEAMDNLFMTIGWDGLVALVHGILPDRSAAYFRETREKILGASIEDLAAQRGGAKGWEAATVPDGPLQKFKALLTDHKEDVGPFVLGSQVSYTDFVAASFLECVSRCDAPGYERLISSDEAFKSLHDACKPWLQRDD